MIISPTTMEQLHEIQLEMLKELIRVMDELNIKYYFVHGSLLGAIRDNDFILEDDDIDIAIFREDYNKLIKYGQTLISSEFFIQNSVTDEYPLPFAKVRKFNTTFRQPILGNCKCNQGVYIDIFPIDYEASGFMFKIKNKLLNANISHVLCGISSSIKTKLIYILSKLYCYRYDMALLKREVLYSSTKKSDFVCIYGGKASERHMPAKWFDETIDAKFRDISVKCPANYKDYLARIYGADYINHNPASDRFDNTGIEISADVLDFEKSYLEYQN